MRKSEDPRADPRSSDLELGRTVQEEEKHGCLTGGHGRMFCFIGHGNCVALSIQLFVALSPPQRFNSISPNPISLPHRVLELSPAAPLAIAPNVGPRLRWIALKLAPQLVGAGCRLSRWLPVQKLAFSDPAIGMSVVVT